MDEGLSGMPLFPEHHVGLHCSKNDLVIREIEGESPEPIGVWRTTFIPDSNGLSVAWVEHPHHGGDSTAQIRSLIGCLSRNRKIKSHHRLAVYRVGSIMECGERFGKSISVNQDPLTGYECHSLVVGIDPESADLLDLIALQLVALEAMVV